MNNTTTITLNDRFSLMKKPLGNAPQNQRGRSRSRSRGRQTRPANLQGSRRNRTLLDALEKQHKMRVALKLKSRSILTSRGRQQGQIIRTKARRAANVRKNVNVRQLQRSNTLTTYVPLNDTSRGPMRGRSRSRSQSRGRARSRSQSRNRNQQTGTIADRLGIRQSRGRMRRGGAPQNQNANQQRSRSRPRSRVRLNRNNFNNNGNRNNNQALLRRSNSVNSRLGNNGPRNQSQSRNASRVRNASKARNANGNVPRNASRPRNANGPRNARGPRNANGAIQNRRRLPANNRGQLINKPMRGRIVKRQAPGLQLKRGNALGVNPRRGLPIKRGANAQGQARGRAPNQNAKKAGGQGAGRGRSRTRRGGKQGGKAAAPKITTEQLDKEMDEYMAKGDA